jgi:AbrB family looped-hinge helix DNA binding protein
MPRVKLTSKGQVTIPKAIRDQLKLEPGVTLRFSVDPFGRIVVTPLTLGIEDLIGILKPRKALTLEEIEEIIGEDPVEREAGTV